MDKKSNTKPIAPSPEKNNKAPSKTTKTVELASPQNKQAISLSEISHDEIALRAYFISERRREKGLEGNPKSDWVEAEKQLRAESVQ
ncbi:MAG: DUF2934 domain-containing protein [Chthoniobacterales bacterium]|nr:DUF2934 domain-containing protein [Chthoniobacterales bacterium]